MSTRSAHSNGTQIVINFANRSGKVSPPSNFNIHFIYVIKNKTKLNFPLWGSTVIILIEMFRGCLSQSNSLEGSTGLGLLEGVGTPSFFTVHLMFCLNSSLHPDGDRPKYPFVPELHCGIQTPPNALTDPSHFVTSLSSSFWWWRILNSITCDSSATAAEDKRHEIQWRPLLN